MKFRNLIITLSCIAGLCACSDDKTFVPEYEVKLPTDTTINVTINASKAYQIIDGFASSDAWDMEYVGNYWSTSNKEGIAKLLFSQQIHSGNPEGIGLSMWRFNIGGGTAEQGTGSGIVDDQKERRADCFLNADGSYTWTKSAGRRYFMEKAKEYGCNQFVLFSNTPPVYYTKNGKGYGSSMKINNLKEEHYDDYANFLATVAEHFQSNGYNISYISPVNEPQYVWSGGQEGCSWSNNEIANLVKKLDHSLTNKGLNDTKLLLAEAGKWDYLYGNGDSGSSYGNVIYNLFNPSSSAYIGNLPHVPNLICGHSYFFDKTWNNMLDVRTQVRNAAEQYNLKVYQTEWSMLAEGYEDYTDYGSASYMDLALSMAKVIHQDLATANVSSWSYWTSCSRERWSQKSRFYLIRLSPGGNNGEDYGDLETNGTYAAGKNLWVLGNYSLFVRPGYQRIDLTMPNATKNFFGTAYLSPDKNKLVVVYTNMTDKRAGVNNQFEGLGKKVVSFQQYTTSTAKNLKQEATYNRGIVPAKSVATFVYELQ